MRHRPAAAALTTASAAPAHITAEIDTLSTTRPPANEPSAMETLKAPTKSAVPISPPPDRMIQSCRVTPTPP
ncbi:hypothetical protein [Streptosporangium sp. NPDC087985]|uniref:hypothetical protein n=1 Tax=Streptosporangium sp. NPDC087985 TaxID=3366196 RepID=UPI003800B9B8